MSDERQTRTALASLGGPVVVSDQAVLERQSRQVLPQLRQLVRGIPARRRRKLWQRRAVVAGGLVLGSALALGVWLKGARTAKPFEVEQGAATSRSDEPHGYSTGPAAGATLLTRQGAHVSLSVNTRLSAIESEQHHERLYLAHGSLRVRVPKLGAGGTFSVQTPDTTVTVHGTVFSVIVQGEGATSQTCVVVDEGLVSVERAGKRNMVKAGERLNCLGQAASAPEPLQVDSPPAAGTTAAASPPAVLPRGRNSTGAPVATSLVGRPGDDGLALQNRLLAAALQAERAGRFADARSQLQELLTRYPASPLQAEAARSLARVTRKLP